MPSLVQVLLPLLIAANLLAPAKLTSPHTAAATDWTGGRTPSQRSAWPVSAPETLSQRGPVTLEAVQPPFRIGYLGVFWDLPEEADDTWGAGQAAVRFRREGTWGPWQALTEDGAEERGRWIGSLASAYGAEAYQLRDVPVWARNPQVVAINTSDGPSVRVATSTSSPQRTDTSCLARADWGADERYRYDAEGRESWPPKFFRLQTVTVHHTVTENDDPDPAATVRAIYNYHAVQLGWGDIGYNTLVDQLGRVYEGRWSGKKSHSCISSNGDGYEFGHDDSDRMVTGGHSYGYNNANFGIALLGTFSRTPPTPAQRDALERELVRLAAEHHLEPQGRVHYVNPESGDEKTVDAIAAHRDWNETACPGDEVYEELPGIREEVASRMGG